MSGKEYQTTITLKKLKKFRSEGLWALDCP